MPTPPVEAGLPTPAPRRHLVSIRAACTLARVSRRTLYNWMAQGKVEFVRMTSGRRRIFADTLIPGVSLPVSEPPLTRSDVEALIERTVAERLEPLRARVRALEDRLTRPPLSDRSDGWARRRS